MRSCNYSLLGMLALFLSGSMASGQTFEISSQDQTHAAGSGAIPFTATFSIEQVTGALEDTKGFSFAYRHDDTLMEVLGANPYVPATVGELAAVNSNEGPDFIQGEVFVDGFTIGVIYAFVDQSQVITFEVPKPMIEVEYATLPGALSGASGDVVSTIIPASDLGTPPTSTVVVIGAGTSAATTALPFSITFLAAPPLTFVVECADQSANFNAASGEGNFTASILIDQDVIPGDTAVDTQGFSFGIGHDSAVLSAMGVDYGAALGSLEGGQGPEYFQVGIYNDGITVGCIYDFQGASSYSFGSPTEAATVDYETQSGALAGSTPGSSVVTVLTPMAGLGPGGVTLVMVVDGQSVIMSGQSGSVTLTATGGFDRGDCNDDGGFNIGDPITLLDALFLGGLVNCDNACDANDDENRDIADGVYMLSALFINGPMPPGTGICAPDPTPGTLSCVVFNSCS